MRASRDDRVTRNLLSRQRQYGSGRVVIGSIGGASFGCSPSPGQRTNVATARDRYLLVADIRLDDRDNLLSRIGGLSREISDADLLLAVWISAGETCLSWIVGDFALAVYDAERRHLTLARDPTGQMPLHYAKAGEEIAFSSMPTGLAPFLGGLAIDRSSLAASAAGMRDDDPRSNFEHVFRVLPGQVVRCKTECIERKIYWNPPTFYDAPLSDADLIEGYRHALDVAVRDRLKDCNGTVATHLSSGYDSSSVTATAARLMSNPRDLIAFTSAPAGAAPVPAQNWRLGDESEVAAMTAANLGIRHVVVRDLPPIQTVIRRQSLLHQELNTSIPNLAWLFQIQREAAEAGASCLLSGECGNASLNAGGLYILPEWLWQGHPLTWARQAWYAAKRPDTSWRGVLHNSFFPFMPSGFNNLLRKYRFGPGPADEEAFLRREWRSKAIASAPSPPRFRNGYDARIHLIRNGNPAAYRKGGQAGEGIDERDPMADRRLVEFSLRIPPQHFYWNGVPRPLARAALSDRLTKAVIELPVRGLQAADWAARFKQSDAYELLEELSQSSTATELFDIEKMRTAITDWPTENWNSWRTSFRYRGSLIAAIAGGMFALVHEQRASFDNLKS